MQDSNCIFPFLIKQPLLKYHIRIVFGIIVVGIFRRQCFITLSHSSPTYSLYSSTLFIHCYLSIPVMIISFSLCTRFSLTSPSLSLSLFHRIVVSGPFSMRSFLTDSHSFNSFSFHFFFLFFLLHI